MSTATLPQAETARPKGGFQKRIDRLTRRIYEVETERDAWRAAARRRQHEILELKKLLSCERNTK